MQVAAILLQGACHDVFERTLPAPRRRESRAGENGVGLAGDGAPHGLTPDARSYHHAELSAPSISWEHAEGGLIQLHTRLSDG